MDNSDPMADEDLFVLSRSTRQASNPYKHWGSWHVSACLTSRRSAVQACDRPLVFKHLQTHNLKLNAPEPLSGAFSVLLLSTFLLGGQA